MIAAPPSTMNRLAQRSLALSPPVVLGGLALLSTFVRMLFALRHHSATYFPDEWIYAGLSRSLSHGHLTIHGDPAHFPAILQPLLAAPLWRFFPLGTAHSLIQLENAVAASLVVVPIYLLARFVGLGRGPGYMCALYAIVVPTLVWIPATISDFVAYPLAIGAIAAAVRAIDRPSPRRQVWFLALMLLATLARVQYFVIAPAYLVAAVWLERRHAFRKHAIAFAALAPAALGAVAAEVGFYDFHRHGFSLSVLTWVPLQAYLLAGITGAIIVPGAVAALVRPRERSHRAFALVISVFTVGLLAEASIPAAQEGRFRERYVFVLLPLAAVSFFVYLQRGRPHTRLVLAVAAALAGAAAYLPVTRYSKDAIVFDTQSMVAAAWLQGHASATLTGLVVAVGITVGAALALLTGRRVVAGMAVPVAIAVSVLITIPATQFDMHIHRSQPTALEWVDRAVGSAPVILIATPSSGQNPMLTALYWNRSITRELIIRPTPGTDPYSKRPVEIGPDGTLLNVSGYFLYNRQGTHATIVGATQVKRVNDLVLYKTTASHPRFVDLVKGQLSNGFASPYTELNVWGAGRATRVTFTVSRPAHRPPAKLYIGTRTFRIHSGVSARFTCTSTQSPFVIAIRSLSEIPDKFNRPVIVKMDELRATAPTSAAAKPKAGCVRLAR